MPKIFRITSGIICVLLLISLTACKGASVEEHLYQQPEQMAVLPTGLLTENDQFLLEWNDEKKCVLLTDKNTNYTWSTIPFSHLQAGDYDYNLEAPLIVEYYDPYSSTIQEVSGIDCIDAGTISAEKTTYGVKVTYYFEQIQISVPVSYDLRKDSISVSINTDDLQESESAQIVSISLTPYLCAVENSPENSQYLFVPSGSGALMYAKEEAEGGGRTFSGDVYGEDLTRMPLYNTMDEEPIRIPVFGARSGENAICAIIEQGAPASRIYASAGDSKTGYSNVYATFQIREYNITDRSKAGKIAEYATIADEWCAGATYSVGYYPLFAEEANYNGMATLYRSYLENKGLLNEKQEQQSSYLVNIVGGELIKTFTLGIPHSKLQAATTFEQAQTILETLSERTAVSPTVLLSGFGSTGLTPSIVAGGFDFANALGGVKQHQVIENYCREKGITVYTDFDVLFFAKSAQGFNTLFDSAKCASLRPTYINIPKVNVRDVNTDIGKLYVLGRQQVNSVVEKLLEFCNEEVSGISFSSLGQYSYSDYSDERYYAKNAIAEQITTIASKVNEGNHGLHFAAANDYAAIVSSCVSQVPVHNGAYDGLDENIPFYSLVFRGLVPMYSRAINTAVDAKHTLLRALEGGVAPSFTLSYDHDSQLATSAFVSFYGTKLENNIDLIEDTVKQVDSFFEKTNNARISKHEILADGVTKTSFDNGVSILINHTDSPQNIEGIELAAASFMVLG